MPHIFISYSSKDRDLINELAADLELLDDVTVWYDREVTFAGAHEWWDVSLNHIRLCDVFIYALSPHIVKSEPCRREYHYARTLGKPILPLMMADVEIRYLPVELQAAQLINFRERSREQQRSLEASVRNLPPAPALPDPLPTPPEAALDLAGVLFDRIAHLSFDADQQRLVILQIEDLSEEEAFEPHIPELLARLIERDDILTAHNLRRAQELLAQVNIPATPLPNSAQAALEQARTFNGKRNADWQPFITTFSDLKIPDMPFCLVPTGTFQMGSYGMKAWDEEPLHSQKMERPYWIAQTPVTNMQWAQAVKAGAVKEPLEAGDSLKWYNDPTMADAPVVGVTWFMARDFAAWMGCRLPTEREWEYAARGVESLRYPWGDDWDENKLTWDEFTGGKPALVQTKPEGKSWVGALHMSGNVWEWTGSLYKEYPYTPDGSRERNTGNSMDVRRVRRGGGWASVYADYMRAAGRSYGAPDYVGSFCGVRIVRSS